MSPFEHAAASTACTAPEGLVPSAWENLRRVIARLVALIVAICLIGGGKAAP